MEYARTSQIISSAFLMHAKNNFWTIKMEHAISTAINMLAMFTMFFMKIIINRFVKMYVRANLIITILYFNTFNYNSEVNHKFQIVLMIKLFPLGKSWDVQNNIYDQPLSKEDFLARNYNHLPSEFFNWTHFKMFTKYAWTCTNLNENVIMFVCSR